MDKLMNRNKRKKYIKRSKIYFRYFWLLQLIISIISITTNCIFANNHPMINLPTQIIGYTSISILFITTFVLMHRIGVINDERAKIRVNKFNLHVSRFYDLLENNEFDKVINYYNEFVSVDKTNGIDKMSSHIAQGFLVAKLNENLDKLDEDTKTIITTRLNLYKDKNFYEY